jgi:hypothetical protein
VYPVWQPLFVKVSGIQKLATISPLVQTNLSDTFSDNHPELQKSKLLEALNQAVPGKLRRDGSPLTPRDRIDYSVFGM